MSFSLKNYISSDITITGKDICSEEEFLYDTSTSDDISYNFFLFTHSLHKYSSYIYLTSTSNHKYTSILYLHPNKDSLLLIVLSNIIDSYNDSISFKTQCILKFNRGELETTDNDDIHNINTSHNKPLEQYNLFLVCDNYILLQCLKKKLLLVDILLKTYSVLYINIETQRSIKVVATHDELIIPQTNAKGTPLTRHRSITRTYVFCISNRQLYFFILNHNAINNTQFILHLFPFDEYYDSINEFHIQRIDRKDEGRWYYLMALLIDGKLIRYITNFVSCSMKCILLNFNKLIKSKQISRCVNTFDKSDECHVCIVHSQHLLSFMVLQIGKSDFFGFKYYNSDSPEDMRKRFSSVDSDLSSSLNNTKGNATANIEGSPIHIETPHSNSIPSDTAIFHHRTGNNTVSSLSPFHKGNVTATSGYSESNKSGCNNFMSKEKDVIYYVFLPEEANNNKSDELLSKTDNDLEFQDDEDNNKFLFDSSVTQKSIFSYTFYNFCIFKQYSNVIALYSFPSYTENTINKSVQLYTYAFNKSDIQLYNIFHYSSLNSSYLLTNKFIFKIRFNNKIHFVLYKSINADFSLSSTNEELYTNIKNIIQYEHFSKTSFICRLCLKSKASIQCEECKSVYYCSKEHQLMDYKRFHFCECELYKCLLYLHSKGNGVLTVNSESDNTDNKNKKQTVSFNNVNKIVKTICVIVNKILEFTNESKDYREYLVFIKIMLNLLRVIQVKNFLNKNFSRYQKTFATHNKLNVLFKRIFNMELWYFYININTLYLNYAFKSKLYLLSTYLLQNSKLYSVYMKKAENKISSHFGYFGFNSNVHCVDISYRKHEINQNQKLSSFFFDLQSIYTHNDCLHIYETFILYHIRTLSSFLKIGLCLFEKTKNLKIQNYLSINIIPLIPLLFEEKINTDNLNIPSLLKQGQLATNNINYKHNQMQLHLYFMDGNYEEFLPQLILSYCYFELCFVMVKLNKISTVIKLLNYILSFIQQLSELKVQYKLNQILEIKILINSGILLSFIGNFTQSIHKLEQANYLCFKNKLSTNISLKTQSLLTLNYININRFDTAYILAKHAIDLNREYFNRIHDKYTYNDNNEERNTEMNKQENDNCNNETLIPKITLYEYMNYIKLKGYLLFNIEFMAYLYNKVNFKVNQYKTSIPIETQNHYLHYESPHENEIYMMQGNIIHKDINVLNNNIQNDNIINENDEHIDNQKITQKLRYLSYKYPSPFTSPEMNIGSKLLHQYMMSSEKSDLKHNKALHISELSNNNMNPHTSNGQNSSLIYASFLFHSDNRFHDIVKAAEFLYELPDSLLSDLNVDNAPTKVETIFKEEIRDRSLGDISKDLSMNISSITMFLLKDNNVYFKEEEVNFTDEIEIKISFLEKLNSIQRERISHLNNKIFLRSVLLRNPKGDINKFNINYHPLYSYELLTLIEKLNENLFIKKISNLPLIEKLEESIFNPSSHKGIILYSLREFFKINRIKQLFISERIKFLEKYKLNISPSSTLFDESNNKIQNESEKIQRKKLIKQIKSKLQENPNFESTFGFIDTALHSIFEQLSLEMLEYVLENPNCIFNYIYTETTTKLSAKAKETKLILNSISSEHKSEKSDYSPNNEYFLGNSPHNLLRGMTLYTPSEFEGSDMQLTSTKHKGKKFFAEVTKLLSNTKLREHSSSPKSDKKNEDKSPPFREHLQRITISDPDKNVSDFFKEKQYNIINTSKVIEEEENDSFFLKTNAKQSNKILSLINPQTLSIPIAKELFPISDNDNTHSKEHGSSYNENDHIDNKHLHLNEMNMKDTKSFEQKKEEDVKDCSYIKDNKDVESPFITDHFGDIIKKVSRKSSGFSTINIGGQKISDRGSKGSKEVGGKYKEGVNVEIKENKEEGMEVKEKEGGRKDGIVKRGLKRMEGIQEKEKEREGSDGKKVHPKFIINAIMENRFLGGSEKGEKGFSEEDVNSVKTKTTNSSNMIPSSSYYEDEDEESNVVCTPVIKKKPSYRTLKDLVFRQKINSKK